MPAVAPFAWSLRQMPKLLLAALLASAMPAAAEVTEHLEMVTYPVPVEPGYSMGELVTRASPIRVHGKAFHGLTRWTVYRNHTSQINEQGRCYLDNIQIRVTATITLPKLVGRASAVQRFTFDKYVAALHLHEMGHYAHGRQAAEKLDQALRGLPDMEHCDRLERTAQTLMQRIVQEHAALDQSYDRRTGHGKTQGVVMGPEW